MLNSEEIILEKREGIASITLNRPDRLNSFTTNMYREFPQIVDQLRRDDQVKAIILTGAGRGFWEATLDSRLDSSYIRAERAD